MTNLVENNYLEKTITVNNVEYIELNVFEEAINEMAAYFAFLGIITKKFGTVIITDEEIKEFLDGEFDDFDINYLENKVALINNKK